MSIDFLDGKAAAVAERVLAEEEGHRRHLVIALSGAHAYGFPSPDSDLDLKAIHIESTPRLLGLGVPKETFDRLEVIEGVEIDYTSNELRGVLAGILAGNGNYIERVLGALIVHSAPEHEPLKALVAKSISKRVHRHYRGFAQSQRKAFEEAEQPIAKKLLYVLRTALTGTHLLRSGELRVDLRDNADEYGFPEAHDLIAAKRQGERTVLPGREPTLWQARLDKLFEILDEAHASSPLPEEVDAQELEDYLVALRLSGA
jgi:hypothetical protein